MSAPQMPAAGVLAPYGGQGGVILATIWVEMVVATCLIGLRFYTRYICGRPGGWGLHWASWSWLVGFIAQILITIAISNSAKRTFDLPDSSWTVPRALMWTWIAIILTFVAIGLSKIAVVAFILALQEHTHHKMRYFLHFLAWSNMTIDVAFVFYLMFRCHPASAIYNINNPTACHSSFASARAFGYAAGTYNAATDLFLALYPLHLFRRLQIPPRAKLGVNIVMSLGVITAGCGAVKTWHLRHITSTANLTFDIFCLIIWTYAEMWGVLICSSVPPLWPLAKLAYGRSTDLRRRSKSWFSSDGSGAGVSAVRGWVTTRPRLPKSLEHSRSRSKSWQKLLVVEKRVPVADVESGLAHHAPPSEHTASLTSRTRDSSPGNEPHEPRKPERGRVTPRELISPPPPFAGYSRSSSDGRDAPPAPHRTDSRGNEIPLPEKAIIMTTDIEISCEQRTAEDGSIRGRDGYAGTGRHDAWMRGEDDDILPYGVRKGCGGRGESSHSEKRRRGRSR